MKKSNLKKIVLPVAVLALVFGIVFPVYAKNDSDKGSMGQSRKIEKAQKEASRRIQNGDKEAENDLLKIGDSAFNNAFRAARDVFNKQIKDARNVYKQDKKTAHDALVASIKSANGNQDAVTGAYTVYRNAIVAALEKMYSSEQAAFSQFITALKNLTTNPVVPVTNHVPVAYSQGLKVLENGSVAITLTGSDPDIVIDSLKGSQLTFIIVSNPTHGTLSGIGANQKYVPSTNFNGSDSFTFKVSDGSLESAVATVTITVVPSNSAPVALNQTVATTQNVALALNLYGSDIDGCSAQSFTYTVDGPANGGLSSSSGVASCLDGKLNFGITYTPKAGFTGTDSFNFRFSDGLVNSNTATVSVTVKP